MADEPNNDRTILVERLTRARRLMRSEEDTGLSGAIEAVLAVEEFTRRQNKIDGTSQEIRTALAPLYTLYYALRDLQVGARVPMFEPRKGEVGQSTASHDLMMLRGHAAAATQLLIEAGQTRANACAEVAKRLDGAGFRLPNGKPITGTTIQTWLRRQDKMTVDDREWVAFQAYASPSALEGGNFSERAQYVLDLICERHTNNLRSRPGVASTPYSST